MLGVLIHVLGDAANNVGVIISGLVIWLTKYGGRFYADPAVSMAISLVILVTSVPLGLYFHLIVCYLGLTIVVFLSSETIRQDITRKCPQRRQFGWRQVRPWDGLYIHRYRRMSGFAKVNQFWWDLRSRESPLFMNCIFGDWTKKNHWLLFTLASWISQSRTLLKSWRPWTIVSTATAFIQQLYSPNWCQYLSSH